MTMKFGLALGAVATFAFAPIASAQSTFSDNQLIGGLIGATAGGVFGSQVSGNGARTEGSAIGAVVGGIAGLALAGGNNNNRSNNTTYSQPVYSSAPRTVYTSPSQPVYSGNTQYPATTTYSQPVYSQPVYSQPVYSRPVVYAPAYVTPSYSTPYYGGSGLSRTSLSINIGSGGFYGGSGRGFNSFRRSGLRNRGFNRGFRY